MDGESLIGKTLIVHEDVSHVILTAKPGEWARLLQECAKSKDIGMALAESAALPIAIFATSRDTETNEIRLKAIDLPTYLAQVAAIRGWDKVSRVEVEEVKR